CKALGVVTVSQRLVRVVDNAILGTWQNAEYGVALDVEIRHRLGVVSTLSSHDPPGERVCRSGACRRSDPPAASPLSYCGNPAARVFPPYLGGGGVPSVFSKPFGICHGLGVDGFQPAMGEPCGARRSVRHTEHRSTQ